MKILVFLTETRLELKNLEFLRRKLGMYRSWGVERSGTRGGLAILWKEEIQVTVQSSSVAHIDATFRVIGITGWHFIGFYGHPETAKRGDSWILLKRLQQYDDMPWLVVGDFNEILEASEKMGRIERQWYQMEAFRQALSNCALQDMGFQGNRFTWWNGRNGDDCVYERLDRGVCSAAWNLLFPCTQVRHIPFANSDHDAILVMIIKFGNAKYKKTKSYSVLKTIGSKWMVVRLLLGRLGRPHKLVIYYTTKYANASKLVELHY
jgi:hypothetical protein